MRIIWLALCLSSLSASLSHAQQWAKDLFDHTSHDFGFVARGAHVEHRFPLENIYVEDVHVAAVKSSCACHKPKIVNPTLETYQKGEIIIELDTRKFFGRKDATVEVVFDKPFPAKVLLNTYCYIRRDVVLEPGTAEFGTIPQGTAAEKKLTISYAGRSDWEISEVESPQTYLEADVREVSRSMSEASYELTIRLNENAPAGYIKDHLTLVTNDNEPKARRVPVPVDAIVMSTIAARPSPLMLPTGRKVTRNLVVQATSPFRILEVTGPDERYQFSFSEDEAKTLQLVAVTFTPGGSAAQVGGLIRIQTNLPGGELVEVRVLPVTVEPQGESKVDASADSMEQDKTANGWQRMGR
jgi:hypothetical protein